MCFISLYLQRKEVPNLMNLDIRLIKDRKEKGNFPEFVKQKEENYFKKNYNGEKMKNMMQ